MKILINILIILFIIPCLAFSGQRVQMEDEKGNILGTSSANPIHVTGISVGGGYWTQTGNNLYPTTIGNNVGIGTTIPPNKLYVAGITEMQGFKMNSGASSGYVLTSNSVGVGTWAPSSGGGGSGTVASGTVNQEAVYTGTTTVGSGIITDDGTNVGVNATSPNGKLDVEGPLTSNDVLRVGLNNNTYSMLAVHSPSGNFGDGGCFEDVEFDVPDVNHDFFVESCGFMEIRSTDPLYYSQPGGSTYIGDGRSESNGDYLKVDDGSAQLVWHSDLGIDATIIDESGQMTTQGEVLSTGFVTSGGTSAQCVRGDGSLGTCGGSSSGLWNTINTNDVYEQNGLTFGNVGIGTTLTTGGRLIVMGGNVGIGTNNPTLALDITGQVHVSSAVNAGSANLTLTNSGNTTIPLVLNNLGTANNTGLEFDFKISDAGSVLRQLARINVIQTSNTSSTPTGDMYFSTNNSGSLAERMRIIGSGNVGIGSSSPTNLLDVTANQNAQTNVAVNNSTSGTGAAAQFVMNGNSGNQGTFGLTSSAYTPVGSINPNQLYFYSNAANGLDFLANNASGVIVFSPGGLSEKDRFNANGNLGIGSATPGQALDVTGNIRVITGVYAASQASAPTIASNDCGTLTQGTVTSGATDLAGSVTAGTAAGSVLSCAVTFGQTHATSPASCVCNDGSTPLALAATYSTTKVTCTALATVASGTISYQCQWNKP